MVQQDQKSLRMLSEGVLKLMQKEKLFTDTMGVEHENYTKRTKDYH